MKIELTIALRYLITKRKEKFISFAGIFSMIGIAIGVAALIVVMSVMNGFQKELMSKILGINGHISISKQNQTQILDVEKEKIKSINGVSNVIESFIMQAMVVKGDGMSGVLINGISYDDLMNHPFLSRFTVFADEFNKDKFVDSAIIGIQLAKTLNVKIGDFIRVIVPGTFTSILGNMPKIKDIIVSGVFNVGMHEYDSAFLYMSYEMVKKFTKNSSFNNIDVFLKNSNLTKSIKKQIIKEYPEYFVNDWMEKNDSFFNALKVEKTVMFTILMLIVIVAMFNIVSSLTMLVYDKSDSIAIMRTMGLSKNSIIAIFIIYGLFIGVIGNVIGIVFGCLVSSNIDNIRIFIEKNFHVNLFDPVVYFLSNLPSDLKLLDVVNVSFLTIIFSFLSTIYPAFKASNTSPGRLLRFF